MKALIFVLAVSTFGFLHEANACSEKHAAGGAPCADADSKEHKDCAAHRKSAAKDKSHKKPLELTTSLSASTKAADDASTQQ